MYLENSNISIKNRLLKLLVSGPMCKEFRKHDFLPHKKKNVKIDNSS